MGGKEVFWPADIQERYGISSATCYRWEKDGRLPDRDFFLGPGKALGWKRATIDAWESGQTVSPSEAPLVESVTLDLNEEHQLALVADVKHRDFANARYEILTPGHELKHHALSLAYLNRHHWLAINRREKLSTYIDRPYPQEGWARWDDLRKIKPGARLTFKVQRKLCDTCLYRDPGYQDDACIGGAGFLICHHSKDACCRAFWNKHKDEFQAGQIAQARGNVEFVDVDTLKDSDTIR